MGFDELTSLLRDISQALERIADNSASAARSLENVDDRLVRLSIDSMLANRELANVNEQLRQNRNAALASAAAMGAANTAAGGGIPAWLIITLVILGLIAVLGLLNPAVLMWIVLATAFLIGVATLGIIAFATLGAIGALAAGIILLADALFNAGLAADPLLQIETNLKNMALTWAKQAYPIAMQMINWAEQFIPVIGKLGDQIITWFGDRLPRFLGLTGALFNDLLAAIEKVGPAIGKFIDHFSSSTTLMNMMGQFIGFVASSIVGLLSNLTRMGDWFISRMPALTSAAFAGFDKIGGFVQWLGGILGQFVDWLLSEWPKALNYASTIISELGRDWNLAVQGFQWAMPILGIFPPLFKLLGDGIKYFAPHLGEARLVMLALGVVAAVLVGIIILFAASALFSVLAIFALVFAIIQLVHWIIGTAIPAVGNFMSALGTFASHALGVIVGFFTSILTFASNAWQEFTSDPAYWLGVLVGDIIKVTININEFIATWLWNFIQFVGKGFKKLVDAAVGEVQALPGQIGGLAVRTMDYLTRALESGLPITTDASKNIALAIGNEFLKLPGQMLQIGGDIARGIVNGFNALQGWVLSQAREFVIGVLASMKEAIVPGSPSRLAALEIGVPISQGVAMGMQMDYPNTRSALSNAMVSLVSGQGGQALARSRITAPVNINQNQQQDIVLKIDNEVLARTIISSVSQWREKSELI